MTNTMIAAVTGIIVSVKLIAIVAPVLCSEASDSLPIGTTR